MWNGCDEKVMAEFGERASVLKLLHLRCSQKLTRWDKYIIIPSLLFSTASAAVISTADPDNDIIRYTGAAMALLSGMLVAVNKHLKFSERADAHKHTSAVYGKINRHVVVELALTRLHRGKSNDILHKTRSMMDAISEQAPLVSQCVVNDFMKNFTNAHKMSMPDICLGLVPIKIRCDENIDDDTNELIDEKIDDVLTDVTG